MYDVAPAVAGGFFLGAWLVRASYRRRSVSIVSVDSFYLRDDAMDPDRHRGDGVWWYGWTNSEQQCLSNLFVIPGSRASYFTKVS